jgi:RNA polymerase sigma-70 factor (ECF subfamily)
MHDQEMRGEFTRLFQEHSRAVMRFALRRFSDSSTCEDVVADTFVVAWKKMQERPAHDRELPWLYGIAFRLLSNQRRSRERRERLLSRMIVEDDSGLDPDESNDFDTEFIGNVLAQLKDSDRELLEFVYWEKLSYREIADIVGVSENAVGIRITRARKTLRLLLPPSFDEAASLYDKTGEFER